MEVSARHEILPLFLVMTSFVVVELIICFAKNSNFAALRKHLRILPNTLLLLFKFRETNYIFGISRSRASK